MREAFMLVIINVLSVTMMKIT